MLKIFTSLLRKTAIKREYSHGEMIEKLLGEHKVFIRSNPVFVETGCGLSTIAINKYAKKMKAIAYSLEYNSDKSIELQKRVGEQVDNIQFVLGDSLKSLPDIVAKHNIDFLFLDSAASAMQTFQEFLICQPALLPKACLLIDNASLPGGKNLLSPVRKGKILVPYLLASPFWEVKSHPRAGDSMISAVLHSEPHFADPDYEHPEYIDHWLKHFDKGLD
jgi:hypothetical protein